MYRPLESQESHSHSLETLEILEQYSDFMESIGTMCDMGCGLGYDLYWWATRTVEDDQERQIPLNIKCTGVDIKNSFITEHQHKNINVVEADIENTGLKEKQFDVIYAHNILQYAINPLQTLGHWYDLARDNAMLVIAVPETTTIERTKVIADQYSHDYYHWSIVSLIHMLAVNGWDCRDGFFKKERNDPWIYAVVYRQPKFEKLDYRTTTWFDLAERDLLPNSAVESLNTWNFVRQQDLQLQWLDKRVYDFRNY